MCFPPPLKYCTLATKLHLLPQFLTYVDEPTIICRELNWIDSHIRSFSVFVLFPVRKTQHKLKNVTFKIYIYIFQILLFRNSVFVNEIKNKFCSICEIVGEDAFSAGPLKSLFFMQIVFFTFYRKIPETNNSWLLFFV